MKNKVVGLILCLLLLTAGLAAVFLTRYDSFYHQHKEEMDASGRKDSAEYEGVWRSVSVSHNNCRLDNYVLGNLAGDLCGYAPITKYQAGPDGKTVQLRQTVPTALEGMAQYIICLSPVDYEEGLLLNTFGMYRHMIKTGREIRLIEPKDAEEDRIEEIRDELSYFEKTLYSYDFDARYYNYSTFLDPESFIRYFIVMELAGPKNSEKVPYYLFMNENGKYALCVSEFPDCVQDPEQDFCLPAAFWYTMLFRDEAFVTGLVNEYRNLREGRLSEEYLEEYLANAVAFITENYPDLSAQEEAEQLMEYLKRRLAWMDENIESLYQYSAKSNIKNYTDDPY